MHAHSVRICQREPPEVMLYEEMSTPLAAPADGEMLLRPEAIGLNFVDTEFRDGSFKIPLPFDTSIEGAGVVTAVGPDVHDFRVGDHVAYFFARERTPTSGALRPQRC